MPCPPDPHSEAVGGSEPGGTLPDPVLGPNSYVSGDSPGVKENTTGFIKGTQNKRGLTRRGVCSPADRETPRRHGLKLLPPCYTRVLGILPKIAVPLRPSRPRSSKEEGRSEEHDFPFKDWTWTRLPLLLTFHWSKLSHMA